MKLLIMAMLLAVMQTSPPVPRKTTDTGSNKSNNAQNGTKAENGNTAASLAVKQQSSPQPSESTRSDQTTKNKEYSVAVGKLPTVSTERDWVDYTALGISILLCMAAFVAARYALKTLTAIQEQARLMDGQLKEMQGTKTLMDKQMEYIVNTERAWVLAELSWYEKQGTNIIENTIKGREATTVYAKLKCVNDGKSPAWIEQVYTHLEIVGENLSVDETGERDRRDLRINGRIGPLGTGKDVYRSVQMNCLGRRKDVNRDSLNAFVVVEYRDIFGQTRETTLGYTITFEGEIIRQDGCRERNHNT